MLDDPFSRDPSLYPAEESIIASPKTVTVFSGAEISRHRELRVSVAPGNDTIAVERWLIYSTGREERRHSFSLSSAEAEALRQFLDGLALGGAAEA